MTYELMVLVVPTVDLTAEKKQMDLVKSLVGDEVVVKSVMSLGNKHLAYEIRKQSEATYLVANIEGSVKSDILDKKAKLMDQIMRCLLTVTA
jgi:ribosomal protein S6